MKRHVKIGSSGEEKDPRVYDLLVQQIANNDLQNNTIFKLVGYQYDNLYKYTKIWNFQLE